MSEFTVTTCEHGMVIKGRVPISYFTALAKAANEYGWDLLDQAIADKLGAVLVVGNHASLDAWRKELGLEPVTP